MSKYKEIKQTTRTFQHDGNYYIDIVEGPEMYEAWLYHKDYGVKMLMFGQTKAGRRSFDPLQDFIDMTLAYPQEYIETYIDRYED